jgi:RNA polymerase sigma-70 factor, ECF subfamily
MERPENAWIAAYRGGDIEALGKLVEHFRRPLFSFILRMMEGHVDAEEIFQETWFRAIKNMNHYTEKSFLSWLFRIAHNLVIDRVRKGRPRVDFASVREDGTERSIETEVAAATLAPDGEVAGRDLGTRIASAVGRLPAEQREVFLLRTEGDVAFKDIARIQGVSINTALARMQYALGKLRAELEKDYRALARG